MPKVKVESIIDKGVYTLILLSTLAIILESDQELSKAYHRLFQNFEIYQFSFLVLNTSTEQH